MESSLSVIIPLVFLCVVLSLVVFFQWKSRQQRGPTELNSDQAEIETEFKDAVVPLRDDITSLYNRPQLMVRLQELMARCDRNHERLALILWDIDGFMSFNNQYGKDQGDIFLGKVAESIKGCLRTYDEAFRCGADEFCAVLMPADERIAKDVTSRVSQTVSRHLFEGKAEYADKEFSISNGVVYYPSEHKLPEALLYAAGQVLYKTRK